MAHPRRIARVSKQIEREIGNLLLHDRVLQEAVCPERKRGLDTAVSALASVTEVVISNDLQVAKVYVSVFSDDAGKETAMAGLKRLEGYVRKKVGQLVRLRLTPEIRFLYDDSIERSERVYALLERVKQQEQGLVAPPPITLPTGYGDDDEDLEARYGDWIEKDLGDDDDILDLDDEEEAFMDLVDAFDEEDGEEEGVFDELSDADYEEASKRMAAAIGAGGAAAAAAASIALPPRRADSRRQKSGQKKGGGGGGRR